MKGSMLLLLCVIVGAYGSQTNMTRHLATNETSKELQTKEQLVNEMSSIQLKSYRAFQSKEANCRNNPDKNGGFYDPYVETCRYCADSCVDGDTICKSKCREYFALVQLQKENGKLSSDLKEVNQKMNFFIAVVTMVFFTALIFGFGVGYHFYNKLLNKISKSRHDNPQSDLEGSQFLYPNKLT